MAKAVFGLVDSEGQAERLVEGLKTAGFSNNDISVLFQINLERETSHTSNIPRPLKAPRQAQVPVEFWGESSVGLWGLAPWLSPASDHLSPPDRSWPR